LALEFIGSRSSGARNLDSKIAEPRKALQINLQFIDLGPYINIMELLRRSDLLETKKCTSSSN
jgi:hypothetical protein